MRAARWVLLRGAVVVLLQSPGDVARHSRIFTRHPRVIKRRTRILPQQAGIVARPAQVFSGTRIFTLQQARIFTLHPWVLALQTRIRTLLFARTAWFRRLRKIVPCH